MTCICGRGNAPSNPPTSMYMGVMIRKRNTQPNTCSRVAQWEHAGPITQRSMDRNHPLLEFLSFHIFILQYENSFQSATTPHANVKREIWTTKFRITCQIYNFFLQLARSTKVIQRNHIYLNTNSSAIG